MLQLFECRRSNIRFQSHQDGGEDMVSRKVAFANAVVAGALAMSFGASASAADLSRRPPPPVVISPWTGLYIGAHVGGVASSETVDGLSTDPSGVIGGLQAGYNFQIAPAWLVGIGGELSWSNADVTVGTFKGRNNWQNAADAPVGDVSPCHSRLVY